MKKITLIFIFLVSTLTTTAQSFIGYLPDNYSGINSVISNPANIVDSRFKTDINLVGVSALVGNDFLSLSISDIDSDLDTYFEDDSNRNASDNNNIFGNVDILGPSFMFNITPKHSIGIFTRARAFYNINEIDAETIENIAEDFDETDDFAVNEGDFFSTGTAWAEIGVSYATVLMDKDEHFLKGGVSLKYLQGLANAYATGRNVSIDFDADGNTPTDGTITSTGDITYSTANGDGFDDFEVVSGATGFAADLGFIYEWRPDYKEYKLKNKDGEESWDKSANKYKLKFGLSLTDLGSINFSDATATTYDLNRTITEQDFDSEEELEDLLETFYNAIETGEAEKSVLPTALHFNADWNINNYFFLNFNTDLAMTSNTKENVNRTTNIFTLSPRFERKWFTFQLPLSVLQYSGFQAGAGFRAGPLYLGSGSILTNLISDSSQAVDIYAGLKIPVYQSKLKDKDGDGVLDKVDECPNESGPAENYGCPWPDSDGDTILDKDDDCPEIAGPVENKGCPWPDTDGDTLLDKDDECPEIAGPVENGGCPWPDTDGDTVLDKDDSCPDVPGTIANNGCPEVTEEVQKTLNEYAKTILFNSGKSTIKEESFTVLFDIVNILTEYPTAKFLVEGHTDSAGSASLNQRLSDARANSVKNYLVEKGIDPFRLSAIGYGEDRPIASNKTRAGRAQNRRVEINLVKE